MTINDMKLELVRLSQEAQGLQTTADAQGRALSAEEQVAIDNNLSKFESLTQEIERRERIEAAASRLAAPQPRRVGPGSIKTQERQEFRNEGEFFRAVAMASQGNVDPRLITNAAGDYVQEGTSADGGYLAPADASKTLVQMLASPTSIFGRLDPLFCSTNSITVPGDENPDWAGTGIHSHTVAEAAAYTATTPIFVQHTLTLAKSGVLVYVTSEMLSDVANIGQYVVTKSAKKLSWTMNLAAWTAIKGAASVKTVAKTSGAAAGSAPDLDNLESMWVGLYAPYRENSVWLVNPNLEPALRQLVLGTYNPVYMPAGGLSQAPYSTLYGRPVIYTEMAAAKGTVGDITLCDPTSFWGVVKNNGIQNSVSEHFKFDQDLTAYKASARFVVASKLSGVITRPDSTTCSNVVVLATRA
jgi:HK97 family phage major capsid protein